MLAREEAKTLYMRYHKDRQGLRKEPRMASVCLICGSADVVVRSEAEPYRHYCRNCGFEFLRYRCRLCGESVDGRDPETPRCRECGWCLCSCGAGSLGCAAHGGAG
ncbi:MAG TPA: hypothetical protein VIU41_14460 [Geobacteraceae bacterium]